MKTEDKCCTGCMIFTGGEIKHHKDCPYYPESLSKMYDELKENNVSRDTLIFHLKALTKDIEDSYNYGFDNVLEEYLKTI